MVKKSAIEKLLERLKEKLATLEDKEVAQAVQKKIEELEALLGK
jgi:hypothetical protein